MKGWAIQSRMGDSVMVVTTIITMPLHLSAPLIGSIVRNTYSEYLLLQ